MTKFNSQTSNSYQTLSSFEASRQLLSQFGDHKMLHTNPDTFLFRESSTDLSQLSLLTLEFVGDVSIGHYTTQNLLLLHIPLSGYFLFQTNQGQKRIEPGQAFMLSPDNKPHFRMPEGVEVIILKMDIEVLQQHAQRLLKYQPEQAISFPLAGFSLPAIKQMKETITLINNHHRELTDNHLQILWSQQAEQLLLTSLLTQFDNNYQTLLLPQSPTPLPQTLQLAHNFMLKHINQPIKLVELSRAAGLSERSLTYQFKKHTGTTPMNYLLNLRLDALRDALHNANGASNVTDIALRFGFNHAGRLAQYYRHRFGELPSKTLIN
jgi:AraC-like DNA-binding protein